MPTSLQTAIQPRFRTVGGVTVRYAESEGPANDAHALLLSPWPESVFAFEPTWPRLAESAHLVAVDPPGFGHSDHRDAPMSPRAMGECASPTAGSGRPTASRWSSSSTSQARWTRGTLWVVDGIASARPVVIFDNAGVGASGGTTPDTVDAMADHAATFIAALGLRRVDILGYSPGGRTVRVGIERPRPPSLPRRCRRRRPRRPAQRGAAAAGARSDA